jgi:Concanavalin A-like lectin/glucanases superfamily
VSRGLVGWWVTGKQPDHRTVAAPLVISGDVTRVKGETGPALHFNGDAGKATVPNAPELNFGPGQNFSVMAWIKPEHAQTSFGVMSIVEKRKVGGILTARGFSLHLEYGRLACQLSPAPGFHVTKANLLHPKSLIALWKNRNALALATSFVSPGPDLRDGRFHHVALTLERQSAAGGKLYVDGQAVLTFDPRKLGGSLANAQPLLIGTHPDALLRCEFKGYIRDVRLYSRALSPEEIEAAAKPNPTQNDVRP